MTEIINEEGDERHRLWIDGHIPDPYGPRWDAISGRCLFVVLHPPPDNDHRDLADCMAFMTGLGCRRAGIVSLFTHRAKTPDGLLGQPARNAPTADAALLQGFKWLREGPGVPWYHGEPGLNRLILAYGFPPWAEPRFAGPRRAMLRDTATRILTVLALAAEFGVKPNALGLTREGWPRHPHQFGYGPANSHIQPVPKDHLASLEGMLE